MPPPKSHKELKPDRRKLLQPVDRRRRRIPAALVVHRAGASSRRRGEERRPWVRNPIERFVLAEAGEPRA